MQHRFRKATNKVTRILALDLHPRRFGYVVMEGGQVLDFGVRRSYLARTDHAQVLVKRRLGSLLKVWAPDVVLTRIGERKKQRGITAIFRHLRRATGKVSFLAIKSQQNYFSGRSKYHRAKEVAACFPELEWKLPAQPKFWESEHYSISIFEALAIAATYVS